MPTGTTDPLDTAQRRGKVVELRRQRKTWDVIGQELGVSKQRAHRIYQEALAEYPTSQLAEHRHEELELIDQAIQQLHAIIYATEPDEATGKAVSARTRVEAISALRAWSQHRATLLGLNAPTRSQVDVVTHDSLAQEMERLAAELGENTPKVTAAEGRALDVALTSAAAGKDA